MTRFTDAIDRLFDELVHSTWRAPRSSQPGRHVETDTVLELHLPIAGTKCSDLGFASEGQRLVITGRHIAAEPSEGSAAVAEAHATFQQSVTLPVGTEPAAIEVRFDPEALRVRIRLRTRSRD